MLCVQLKTPDDGQRNCPKYVEFLPKNKFEKLVHLVGFIIRKKVLEYLGQFEETAVCNFCMPCFIVPVVNDCSESNYSVSVKLDLKRCDRKVTEINVA